MEIQNKMENIKLLITKQLHVILSDLKHEFTPSFGHSCGAALSMLNCQS